MAFVKESEHLLYRPFELKYIEDDDEQSAVLPRITVSYVFWEYRSTPRAGCLLKRAYNIHSIRDFLAVTFVKANGHVSTIPHRVY